MIPPDAFTTPSAVGRLLGFSFQQLCISVYLARGRGNRTYLNVYRVIEIHSILTANKLSIPHTYTVFTLTQFGSNISLGTVTKCSVNCAKPCWDYLTELGQLGSIISVNASIVALKTERTFMVSNHRNHSHIWLAVEWLRKSVLLLTDQGNDLRVCRLLIGEGSQGHDLPNQDSEGPAKKKA